jgi:hypothetical protein
MHEHLTRAGRRADPPPAGTDVLAVARARAEQKRDRASAMHGRPSDDGSALKVGGSEVLESNVKRLHKGVNSHLIGCFVLLDYLPIEIVDDAASAFAASKNSGYSQVCDVYSTSTPLKTLHTQI